MKIGLAALLRVERASVSQAVETFLTVRQAGKSVLTIKWYRDRLSKFSNWMGGDYPVNSVLEADLVDWLAFIDRQDHRWGGNSVHPKTKGGYSQSTKAGLVRALRTFFGWLHDRGVIETNPAKAIPMPKIPKRGKQGVSDEAVDLILSDARLASVRDFAILMLVESTGCRRGGIANLMIEDLNINSPDERLRRRLTVHEKFGKDRMVVMGADALEALCAWMVLRNQLDVPGEDGQDRHVFVGQKNGDIWKPLKPGGISQMVQRYKERLGIRGKTSPHQWRHRWARHMLSEGMDLSQVSQLMGHEDVSVTVAFYGQFSVDQLQDAYDRVRK